MRATRRSSTRHLLTMRQVQESLVVASPPSLQNACVAGLQAALSILIALAATHLSPWPHLVAFPALGALAALFGRYASIARRRQIVFICGALLTAGVFFPSVASYAGASAPLMVVLLA
ncbi:MAG TPA: FUSC family protein, partial [Candidimonas sp.]|nr:FUSC family protein [Candidimonas sp.]